MKFIDKTVMVSAIVMFAMLVFAAPPALQASTIAYAEYYFDNDPGQGNGSLILPADGNFGDPNEYFKSPIICGLTEGNHTLFLRLKDNNNNWGVPRRFDFSVHRGNPYKRIVEAEYFIDTDHGLGSGVALDSIFGNPFVTAHKDTLCETGTYYVRFRDSDTLTSYHGWGPTRSQYYDSCAVGVGESDDNLPSSFSISQNYPNPFNPMTDISYALPRASHVTIQVFDLLGRLTATLADENQEAGYHQLIWNGSKEASGIYLYRIQAGEFSETKKMLLLK